MSKLRENGFTLVELLVISPVVMITIVMMMSFLFNQYGRLTQQGALINLQTEAQNIAFSMQDDVFFASSFEPTKNGNLADTYEPAGGWDYDTAPATLIISTLALTESHRSENRQPVYINTEGCSPQEVLESNAELYNNVIYFANGTNLYKRYLSAPATMDTCGTSFFKQTCPEANASPVCPADRLLTDKLHSFTVTYFDTNNNATSNPSLADKVKVDLELKDKAFAEEIFASSTLTMKKLNQ